MMTPAPAEAASGADVGDRERLLAAERLRVQYQNMPTAILGSAIAAALMGFALFPGAGLQRVLIWNGWVCVWALARLLQWRAFNRAAPGADQMARWRLLAIAGSAV